MILVFDRLAMFITWPGQLAASRQWSGHPISSSELYNTDIILKTVQLLRKLRSKAYTWWQKAWIGPRFQNFTTFLSVKFCKITIISFEWKKNERLNSFFWTFQYKNWRKIELILYCNCVEDRISYGRSLILFFWFWFKCPFIRFIHSSCTP